MRTMMGKKSPRPSIAGGSLMLTLVAGSRESAPRAASLSARMPRLRTFFGTVSARIFTLFASPLSPTIA